MPVYGRATILSILCDLALLQVHLSLVRIPWMFVCQVVCCFTVAPAGLCERHRVISQHNNNCGSGCEGLCMICEILCKVYDAVGIAEFNNGRMR